MPKKHKKRSYRHLNQADRDRLQALCDEGVKQKEIAKILNVDPGTISREISRNRRKYRKRRNIKNKNARYEASVANHKAYLRRKYSKYQGKQINENEDLKMYIIAKLKQHWNPDGTAAAGSNQPHPLWAFRRRHDGFGEENRQQGRFGRCLRAKSEISRCEKNIYTRAKEIYRRG